MIWKEAFVRELLGKKQCVGLLSRIYRRAAIHNYLKCTKKTVPMPYTSCLSSLPEFLLSGGSTYARKVLVA